MSNYHNIYVPLLDVFDAGGPTTFTDLSSKTHGKKNLVVLSPNILSALRSKDAKGSQSAYDIGEYMRTHFSNPLTLDGANNGIRGFSIDEQLDVMILPQSFMNDPRETLESYGPRLNKKVKELVKYEKNSVDFLTSNNYDGTLLSSLQLRQSKPKFLMANAEIVKRGVIQAKSKFKELIFSNASVSIQDANEYFDEPLQPNQFIDLGKGHYARVTGDLREQNGYIKGIDNLRVEKLSKRDLDRQLHIGTQNLKDVLGVVPRDMHQFLALQYGLFDPTITTSFITGSQGSGKTLLAYAAAIELMCQHKGEYLKKRVSNRFDKEATRLYDRLVLMKPITQVGDDELGFLPGSLKDKLSPYLEPFQDAHRETSLPDSGYQSIDSLFTIRDAIENPGSAQKKSGTPKKLSNKGNPPPPGSMEILFYGMSRGRSLHNTLIVIDEAQNLKPYMMKTLIERMGQGSKMVILGDPYQVDAKSGCTPDMNGLTHAYKHLMPEPFTAGVHLEGHYRSHDSNAVRDWSIYK